MSSGALHFNNTSINHENKLLQRGYNSRVSFKNSILGKHWFFAFEKKLGIVKGQLVFVDPLNPEYSIYFKHDFLEYDLRTFAKRLHNTTLRSCNTYYTISLSSEKNIVVTHKTLNTKYHLDTTGRVIKIDDGFHIYDFNYSKTFLTSITKGSKELIRFTYLENSIPSLITKSEYKEVRYLVEDKNLVSVDNLVEEKREYYTYTNNQLEATPEFHSLVYRKDGCVLSYTDKQGKVDLKYEETDNAYFTSKKLENGLTSGALYTYHDKKHNILDSLKVYDDVNDNLPSTEVNFINNKPRHITKNSEITSLLYNELGQLVQKNDGEFYTNLEYDNFLFSSVRLGNAKNGLIEWTEYKYNDNQDLKEIDYSNYKSLTYKKKVALEYENHKVSKISYKKEQKAPFYDNGSLIETHPFELKTQVVNLQYNVKNQPKRIELENVGVLNVYYNPYGQEIDTTLYGEYTENVLAQAITNIIFEMESLVKKAKDVQVYRCSL